MWAIGIITYILLCGCEPFYDQNEQETLGKMMRCDLDFFSPEWDDVSKYAKDFVSALIVLDPAGRLSAREALAHPWVKGVGVRGRHMGTTLDNIAEFNAKR